MMLKVSIVVGNPKPASRTLKVAEAFAAQLLAGAPCESQTIDLVDYCDEIFQWPNERLDGLNSGVAGSNLAIFASPTYKATYTGLLKAFLDRYPSNGLSGVVAIPLLTGAGLAHSMGPTVNLAPLLVELGAVVPGRGVYFVTDQMDRMEEIVAELADSYRANLQRLGALAQGLSLLG